MDTSITRVLLPVSFNVLSERAAQYARMFMSAFDPELHILHVVAPTEMLAEPDVTGATGPVYGRPSSEVLADAKRNIQTFIQRFLPAFAERVRIFTAQGGVTDAIIQHAVEQRIDLIVMGTHADGPLRRLVFGSVGKAVLEGSPCPVLLVPVHRGLGDAK